jgi:hypothetical protein
MPASMNRDYNTLCSEQLIRIACVENESSKFEMASGQVWCYHIQRCRVRGYHASMQQWCDQMIE